MTIAAAVIALVLWINMADSGPIYQIKNASFSNYGSQTIEAVVDKKIENATWSCEEITDGYFLVYINGYMPLYEQDVRVVFSYQEYADNTFEFELIEVDLMSSNLRLTDIFSMTSFIADLYA